MLHDSQEVAAPDLLDIGIAVTLAEQLAGEVKEFGTVCKATHTTIAIEVGAKTYMVDAHNLDGMVEMGHHIEDRCFSVAAQETVIDGGLCHTTLGSKGTHLVVGEVTRMVAEGTSGRMAAHDRLRTDVEGIVKTLLACMAHIDEDAQAVHLLDDLFTKGADTVMCLIALRGGVADVVVAIMAEGHIDDATIGKVLEVRDIMFEGDTILDTQHDTLET